jgi:glyoxylase-like metal-dependent hydrolase (beta-lactamase superfamily II)
MIIEILPSGPFETNAYIVACSKTSHAAIIDPAPGSAEKILSHLSKKQWQPSKILITHSHWDHIADTAQLKQKLNVPVYVHSLDAPNLKMPGSDNLPCWIEIEGVVPDVLVEEGDTIPIGELQFQVIHTPGHTPGGVCFYLKEQGTLFSGDTLFKGTIGNLSFPTAQPELMWTSLEKLSKLPFETKVYPGHGPSTTIGQEKWLSNAKKIFG